MPTTLSSSFFSSAFSPNPSNMEWCPKLNKVKQMISSPHHLKQQVNTKQRSYLKIKLVITIKLVERVPDEPSKRSFSYDLSPNNY